MATHIRNVSRLTLEVTLPLTDESMANPFNLAVEAVELSGLYPDVAWEDSPISDRLDFERQSLTVTLSEVN